MNSNERAELIKSTAYSLGFDHCGIAKAVQLEDDARRLEKWLTKGMQGSMHYMERYFDMRIDPRKLVPGAKSVITLLLNYYPSQHQRNDAPQISKYAYGKDYHLVIKDKLNALLAILRKKIGNVEGRGFVDSAPVLERTWAQRTGLGWVGKNGNLINKGSGSYYFIATLITDLELAYDAPFAMDHCGTCNRCVEACPTEAILPEKTIDGSKCISYFTIELKAALIPGEMKGKFENRMFGCDICQEVCPWNRFATATREKQFTPLPEILNFSKKEWEEISQEQFNKIFKDSPIKRSKYEGILRNIKFLEER